MFNDGGQQARRGIVVGEALFPALRRVPSPERKRRRRGIEARDMDHNLPERYPALRRSFRSGKSAARGRSRSSSRSSRNRRPMIMETMDFVIDIMSNSPTSRPHRQSSGVELPTASIRVSHKGMSDGPGTGSATRNPTWGEYRTPRALGTGHGLFGADVPAPPGERRAANGDGRRGPACRRGPASRLLPRRREGIAENASVKRSGLQGADQVIGGRGVPARQPRTTGLSTRVPCCAGPTVHCRKCGLRPVRDGHPPDAAAGALALRLQPGHDVLGVA